MSSSSCLTVSGNGSERRDKKDEKGIGAEVAQHYNSLPETGLAARTESRIYHMRNFNNWIKSQLIGEALNQVRRAKGDNRAPVAVLDIGCGKGGDLLKYKIGNISRLICTDIAETSLDQCRERWQQMRGRKFECEFVAADSTRDRLRERIRDRERVDMVSVQFVLHYSFESVAQAETMLRNVSENLTVGGFWIGTTTDADQLVARARSAQSPHFGNEVYNVTFQDDAVLLPDERLPLFGCKYDFHLEGCVNCPEFLLHFPTLEHMALRYGLRRAVKQNFADFFADKENTSEGRNLLKRMKALERYPPDAGCKPASESVGEYEHADQQLESGDRRSVGTISRSEWEAITLYCVFAFQKFREIDGEEVEKEVKKPKRESDNDRHRREDRKRDRSPDTDRHSHHRRDRSPDICYSSLQVLTAKRRR